MRPYLFRLSAFILFFVSTTVQGTDLDAQFQSFEAQEQFLIKTLKSMSREVNQQTPIKVDQHTQLNSVIALGKTLTYNYQFLDLSVSDIHVNEARKSVQENLNDMVCLNQATQTLIQLGVTYTYLYFDKAGRHVMRVVFDSYRCD